MALPRLVDHTHSYMAHWFFIVRHMVGDMRCELQNWHDHEDEKSIKQQAPRRRIYHKGCENRKRVEKDKEG